MTRNQHTHGWTDEQDAALRKHVGEGLSAGQIAKAMAKLRPGINRSAVVGRVHRLGPRLGANIGGAVTRRKPKPAKPAATPSAKPRNRNVERTREKVVTIALPPPAEPVRPDAWAPLRGVKPIALMARKPSQCPWPVGEAAEPHAMMCCGAPKGDDYYCSVHMAMRRGTPWRRVGSRSP